MEKSFLFITGKVGDWKGLFSKEQNAQLMSVYQKVLGDKENILQYLTTDTVSGCK